MATLQLIRKEERNNSFNLDPYSDALKLWALRSVDFTIRYVKANNPLSTKGPFGRQNIVDDADVLGLIGLPELVDSDIKRVNFKKKVQALLTNIVDQSDLHLSGPLATNLVRRQLSCPVGVNYDGRLGGFIVYCV